MSEWVEAPITSVTRWDDGLWSMRFDAKLAPYRAGQWTNLALDIDGERVRRPYSLASAPDQPPEVLVVRVDGGALTPALEKLEVGDRVWVQDAPQGFFTLDEVPPGGVLWLVATGTGLGPYLAMLDTEAPWRDFERVVLVHGVRTAAQRACRDRLDACAARHPGRLSVVHVVSREDVDGALHGRITTALASGALEAAAGAKLEPGAGHVLLCGNPAMVTDMCAALDARGMKRHRRRRPGHVTVEKYW